MSKNKFEISDIEFEEIEGNKCPCENKICFSRKIYFILILSWSLATGVIFQIFKNL